MELKDKLKKVLNDQYGIKTDEDLEKELDNMPFIDLGIFVSKQKEEFKSA
jgi:hypothetical protein